MATKLKDLVITKVALVDEGACSAAHIQLYKRKEKGGPNMGYEEILNNLPEDQQEVIKAKMTAAEQARMKAEEEKKKAEEARMAAEAGMKKNKEPEKTSEEDILKSLDPAVRAIVEKSRLQAQAAEEAVKKMKAEQEEKEAIEKANNLSALGSVEELTEVIKGLNTLDSDMNKKVFSLLQKANTVVSEGLFKEKGSSFEPANTSDDAWGKIEAKASDIAKAKNISQSQAISDVIQDEPELYQEYLKSQYAE